MAFQLDPEGGAGSIMRRFHGRWQIRPHPADPEHACMSTLDQARQLGCSLIMRHTHWLRGPATPLRSCTARRLLAPLARCTRSQPTFCSSATRLCCLVPACCRILRWASPCPRPSTASSSASRATRCGLGAQGARSPSGHRPGQPSRAVGRCNSGRPPHLTVASGMRSPLPGTDQRHKCRHARRRLAASSAAPAPPNPTRPHPTPPPHPTTPPTTVGPENL